jgi:hypothetical protein
MSTFRSTLRPKMIRLRTSEMIFSSRSIQRPMPTGSLDVSNSDDSADSAARPARYPSWNDLTRPGFYIQKAIEAMAIEIVDCPIENGDFL